jgi:ABC-type Mn2+/Zn2+ transport system ATPase subunit
VVIDARGLTLAYDGRTVLANVDLTVRRGEFWFVLGRNGSGKSTLLRAIVGTLPSRGGALVLHPEFARRDRMGYVPQRCDLSPALPTTVREFVLLGLVGIRTTRADERDRLEWALARAELGGMGRRDYWSLSGGERQRALLARALVRRPSFLVLDEPTTHLDPQAEKALFGLLAGLNREERVSLLVVTHDVALAAHHATHVALLDGGTVHAGSRIEMQKAFGG